MPARSNSAGSTWRSRLPSSGSPSESARRFAGSIVSTATRLPRAAIPAAIAAEVVVLPTPPEPAQTQMRLPSSRSATPAIRPSPCPPGRRSAPSPSSGSNRNGSVLTGAFVSRSSRASCSALIAAAALLGERGAQRGARGRRRHPAPPPRSASPPPGGSAPGRGRCRRSGRPSTPTSEASSRSSAAVSFTGISSGSATTATPVRSRSRMNPSSVSACWRIGPTRAMLAKVRGRLQEADPVPGRGRVDDDQVVTASAAGLALVERQLPDLPDRDQLLEPRRRGGEVVEDPRAEEQVAHRLHLQLQEHVLAHRLVGVDRDRPQVLGQLDLVEAHLAALEHVREVLLGGDLAEDRPLARRGRRRAPGRPRRSICRPRPCR